jgi:hypothetical protein
MLISVIKNSNFQSGFDSSIPDQYLLIKHVRVKMIIGTIEIYALIVLELRLK